MSLRLVSEPAPPPPAPSPSLQSGGFFIAANLAAGLLHYFYQLSASRQLTLLEFSAFNAWYANLAVFFSFSGLLQFGAIFMPLRLRHLRLSLGGAVIAVVVLLAVGMYLPSGLTLSRAFMVWIAAAVFAWLSGQVQCRLHFTAMAISALLLGLGKLSLLTLPWPTQLDTYTFALIAAYAPALVPLAYVLWLDRQEVEVPHHGWRSWISPVILSFAVATIPQMDLVILNQTQTPENFAPFALASLFYKGIYFIAFAYLQWLLPQQLRRGKMATAALTARAALALVLISLAVALTGPHLGVTLLHWSSAPSATLVFLTCVNACLLTWLLVGIQGSCARGDIATAIPILLALLMEGLAQWLFALNPLSYLALAVVTQTLIVVAMQARVARVSSTPQPPRPRPQLVE